jgi:hypothetical protein
MFHDGEKFEELLILQAGGYMLAVEQTGLLHG